MGCWSGDMCDLVARLTRLMQRMTGWWREKMERGSLRWRIEKSGTDGNNFYCLYATAVTTFLHLLIVVKSRPPYVKSDGCDFFFSKGICVTDWISMLYDNLINVTESCDYPEISFHSHSGSSSHRFLSLLGGKYAICKPNKTKKAQIRQIYCSLQIMDIW